jgi:peptidyl-prolyl cis-trans isomerase A (cyclophilin A)
MFATAFSRAPARPRRRAVTLAAVAAAALAAACGGRRGPSPARLPAPLVTPDPRQERAAAPDTFDVRFETSRGPFVVRVARAWAPRGADRLYYLVRNGYYTEARFFRVLPRFAAQWGAAADPRINRVWETRTIPDDPVRRGNARGTVSFATAGPNTRTTQLFVNLVNNFRLDRLGFTPVGRVVEGMEVVDSLYGGYGESAPDGKGPNQDRIAAQGNAYLAREFPKLDYIRTATVVRAAFGPRPSAAPRAAPGAAR